jgi:DnaJ-class molecular chaperone
MRKNTDPIDVFIGVVAALFLAAVVSTAREDRRPPAMNVSQCPACGGSGRQSLGFGFQTTPGMCPQCGGSGRD